MTTDIISDGCGFLGHVPSRIPMLLDLLGMHALDATFAPFHHPEPNGMIRFHGSFRDLSHVFSISTDERDVIEALTAAIAANMGREDYEPLIPSTREPDKPDVALKGGRGELRRIMGCYNVAVNGIEVGAVPMHEAKRPIEAARLRAYGSMPGDVIAVRGYERKAPTHTYDVTCAIPLRIARQSR